MLTRWLGPIPRVYPFGNGTYCDGCDVRATLTRWDNGGLYCPRCLEEVASIKS